MQSVSLGVPDSAEYDLRGNDIEINLFFLYHKGLLLPNE